MKAIFSGSFNPINNGHIEIIKYASETYDELIIYVANNELQKYSKSLKQRFEIVEKAVNDLGLKNIKILMQKPGFLTPDVTKELGINVVLRRSLTKNLNSYEEELSEKYLDINEDLIFNYVVNKEYKFTSKELIEKIQHKDKINGLVPEVVRREIELLWKEGN